MGVPAFFRWLTIRYPKVVIDALSEDDIELLEMEYQGDKRKNDSNEIDLEDNEELKAAAEYQKKRKDKEVIERKIKENNPYVDNLYLDMNGIIHPCAHPQHGQQP
jgi:5'-3' exoribonuclease 2